MRLLAPVLVLAALFGAAVRAATFPLPPEDVGVVGHLRSIKARSSDTFVEIARYYDIGYDELRRANPHVDPWLPGEGTRVLLPLRFILPDAPREGVVLNLPELRLYYYPKPKAGEPAVVMTFPISIGRMDWTTPQGLTRVAAKVRNPSWYPPESIRKEHEADGDPLPKRVPPGPDNPLGGYAIRLGIPGYLIHSTNKPSGVGMRVTHGCVRMFPEDVELLFESIPVGTPVRIINQSYKTAWVSDALYLEVHPLLEEEVKNDWDLPDPVLDVLKHAMRERREPPLRWSKARQANNAKLGIPVPVTAGSPDLADLLEAVPLETVPDDLAEIYGNGDVVEVPSAAD